MASITKRTAKDGAVSWRALIRIKGFDAESGTFTKRAHAVEWAAKTEEAMRCGHYGIHLTAREKTVSMLIEHYIATVLEVKSRKRSYITQQRAQLFWWRGQIGTLTLAQLTRGHITEARGRLLAQRKGGRRTGATINRYMAVLSHALSVAVEEWGWVADHPMKDIKPLPESQGRTRYLLDHEVPALLTACRQEKRKPLYLIVLLALATGARKMEILTIKRKDINTTDKSVVIYETKNGQPRTLYLFDALFSLLLEWVGELRHRHTLVFATRNGVPMNIEREWHEALERADIEGFRFHDLRHTHASYLRMHGGASANDIASSLGQRGLANVQRYAHIGDSHLRGIVTGMGAKLFQSWASPQVGGGNAS